MRAKAVDNPDRNQPHGYRRMSLAVLIGGAIGAISSLAGMQVGDAYGYGNLLPLAAGAIGAGLVGVFLPYLESKTTGARRSMSEDDPDGPSLPSTTSPQIASPPLRPLEEPTEEPEWPIETHKVQLKLDLAKEYLAVREVDLAGQMLQEVLELEVLAAGKISTELLVETRDALPGTGESVQTRARHS